MKIVLLEPIGISKKKLEEIRNEFQENNNEFLWYSNIPEDDIEIISRCEDADIIILSNLPLSSKIIDSCKKLKMISVAFAGVDHIVMDTCRKNDIVVCNAAAYSNHAVAELTIGLIISLYRKIIWADKQTRQLLNREGFLGSELFGKTFGIIGTGNIGINVAKLANAFGCKVIAYSKTIKDIDNVEFHDLNYVLENSDIVSLHLPLNEKTKYLISKNELYRMKSNAILINTARGAIVDTKALSDVLKNRDIAGAAIDVYENEPPLKNDNDLFNAPNTILSPHIAYATQEAIKNRGNIVIENIKKWIDGDAQNVIV